MSIDFKKNKRFTQLNLERCRKLYDTGILFDGGNNLFTQSVFIELMIQLRHLDHILTESTDNPIIIKMRDASAHPHLNREIEGGGIVIDFGRNYKGNWKYENNIFINQDDTCDIEFQYGDTVISAKEILKLIEFFEDKLSTYEY